MKHHFTSGPLHHCTTAPLHHFIPLLLPRFLLNLKKISPFPEITLVRDAYALRVRRIVFQFIHGIGAVKCPYPPPPVFAQDVLNVYIADDGTGILCS